MGIGRARWDSPDWPEASEEARAVLIAATEWRLREPRWYEVRGAVEKMAAALAAADLQSLVDAAAQLEQLGPLRVATRLGDPPNEPAPADVRERINELIDALVPDDNPAPGDRSGTRQNPGHDSDVSTD